MTVSDALYLAGDLSGIQRFVLSASRADGSGGRLN